MVSAIERPEGRTANLGDILRGCDRETVANALVSFLFSCTGPLAILLVVAAGVGLGQAETNAWIAGGYGIGGVLTLALTIRYRRPLILAFSIPGIALMATALTHMTLAEAVGAYIATGLLMTALGLSGWAGRLARLAPLAVVMGMVAGVFLPIGLKIITGFAKDPLVSLVTVGSYFAVAALPRLGRVLPPVLASLIFGGLTIALSGGFHPNGHSDGLLTLPLITWPAFSWSAMIELVIPLAISVLVIQNMQGYAILRATGHPAPVNLITTACGIGSIPMALLASVPTCLTGPSTAIITASGHRDHHFAGAVIYGVLMVVFGVAAPLMTWLAAGLPGNFIATIGGLALLPILQNALRTAFTGGLTLGALVAFMVTVAGLDIGAPFWGLVFGLGTSWLLERKAMREAFAAN